MSILKKKNVELERENYSNCKSDKVVTVDQYISEGGDKLITDMIVRAYINKSQKVLMIAPTGSGKTYSIVNELKTLSTKIEGFKALFIVPNVMQVKQLTKDNNWIGGAFDTTQIYQLKDKYNVIACTWDKVADISKDLIKDYVCILDECHQIYVDAFRVSAISGMINKLAYAKGQLNITATPKYEDFNAYSYILEYKQKNKTKYTTKLYNKICDKTILDICTKSEGQFLLLRNNTDKLNFIKDSLSHKKIDVLTSPTKHLRDSYNMITENSNIGDYDGICTTTMMCAGVNIKDSNITDIIVVDQKDISTIKQFSARPRELDHCNIHIFNNFSEDISAMYKIHNLVDKTIEQSQNAIDVFNDIVELHSKTKQVKASPSLGKFDDRNFYWSEYESKYMISKEMITNSIYQDYYNRADVQSYAILLEEYFPNVEIMHIEKIDNKASKEYIELSKEKKKVVKEYLKEHLNDIIGATEILGGTVDKKLERYINEHNTLGIVGHLENLENISVNGINIKSILLDCNMAKIINGFTRRVVHKGLDVELAWHISNLSNRAIRNFYDRLNNIIYYELEKLYGDLLRNITLDEQLYQEIDIAFGRVGTNYNQESLEIFCKYIERTLKIKLTVNKLGEILKKLYIVEQHQTRSATGLEMLFIEKDNPIHVADSKQIRYNTIKGKLTLDYFVEDENLSEVSKATLQTMIDNKINEVGVSHKFEEIQGVDISEELEG